MTSYLTADAVTVSQRGERSRRCVGAEREQLVALLPQPVLDGDRDSGDACREQRRRQILAVVEPAREVGRGPLRANPHVRERRQDVVRVAILARRGGEDG